MMIAFVCGARGTRAELTAIDAVRGAERADFRFVATALFLAATLLSAIACQSAVPAPPVTRPAPAAAASNAEAQAQPPNPATASQPSQTTYDNTIKWSTASEVDNFGFDVFRGDSADGPFERINAETIEGGGTVDEPQSYRFVDDTIDPYRTYYYYVESISMGGVRERFTPVGNAGPKIKPEEN